MQKSKSLTEHLGVDRYGDFWLTDAIRPAVALTVVPQQGYRVDVFRDARAKFQVPVLAAAVSREDLFDVFLDLLGPLGEEVDIVLETSHESSGTKHLDLFREGIDLAVLQSHCCEFEELLTHDGCTGIAVLSSSGPMEVQFDEHKLLVVYAGDVSPFVEVLEQYGIGRDDGMKLITEGEHLHSTDAQHRQNFEQFCYRLGVGRAAERVSW